MNIYKRIEKSHHLSSYEIDLPIWDGDRRKFKPFESWKESSGSLDWFQAYNASKHDRVEEFKTANFHMLVTAVSGLLVLMTAQFRTQSFSSGSPSLAVSGYDYDDLEPTLGSLFRVRYPDDWSEDEIYDFDWSDLSKKEIRFARFDYNHQTK